MVKFFFFNIFYVKMNVMISPLLHVFQLMRVSHYVKNSFIFLPLFFSGRFFDFYAFSDLLQVFIGFSCLASAIYVINDIFD